MLVSHYFAFTNTENYVMPDDQYLAFATSYGSKFHNLMLYCVNFFLSLLIPLSYSASLHSLKF